MRKTVIVVTVIAKKAINKAIDQQIANLNEKENITEKQNLRMNSH
jgi:hypothetical protein